MKVNDNSSSDEVEFGTMPLFKPQASGPREHRLRRVAPTCDLIDKASIGWSGWRHRRVQVVVEVANTVTSLA